MFEIFNRNVLTAAQFEGKAVTAPAPAAIEAAIGDAKLLTTPLPATLPMSNCRICNAEIQQRAAEESAQLLVLFFTQNVKVPASVCSPCFQAKVGQLFRALEEASQADSEQAKTTICQQLRELLADEELRRPLLWSVGGTKKWTPLHHAAYIGKEEVVKELLQLLQAEGIATPTAPPERDVLADAYDTNHRAPWWLAAERGHDRVLEILLPRAFQLAKSPNHILRRLEGISSSGGFSAIQCAMQATPSATSATADTNIIRKHINCVGKLLNLVAQCHEHSGCRSNCLDRGEFNDAMFDWAVTSVKRGRRHNNNVELITQIVVEHLQHQRECRLKADKPEVSTGDIAFIVETAVKLRAMRFLDLLLSPPSIFKVSFSLTTDKALEKVWGDRNANVLHKVVATKQQNLITLLLPIVSAEDIEQLDSDMRTPYKVAQGLNLVEKLDGSVQDALMDVRAKKELARAEQTNSAIVNVSGIVAALIAAVSYTVITSPPGAWEAQLPTHGAATGGGVVATFVLFNAGALFASLASLFMLFGQQAWAFRVVLRTSYRAAYKCNHSGVAGVLLCTVLLLVLAIVCAFIASVIGFYIVVDNVHHAHAALGIAITSLLVVAASVVIYNKPSKLSTPAS
eukprot:jgi/Chlat1/3224/Chrsp22S08808